MPCRATPCRARSHHGTVLAKEGLGVPHGHVLVTLMQNANPPAIPRTTKTQ